jgi:hypothetical protein
MVMEAYAPRFISIGSFDRRWASLGLDDNDLQMLEILIQADPDGPPLVKGTGGLRKVRFAGRGSGRGKSGSYRIGYAHFPNPGIVLLLEVWAKNEKSDLSQAERNAIAAALVRFEKLIKTGMIR